MTRKHYLAGKLLLILSVVVFCCLDKSFAFVPPQQPGTGPGDGVPSNDTLKFPLKDRRADRFTQPSRNPFDLQNPPNITDSIVYDFETNRYYIIEKVGSFYYRKPTYLTFDEFLALQARRSEIEYFRKRSNILSTLNKKNVRPKLSVTENEAKIFRDSELSEVRSPP